MPAALRLELAGRAVLFACLTGCLALGQPACMALVDRYSVEDLRGQDSRVLRTTPMPLGGSFGIPGTDLDSATLRLQRTQLKDRAAPVFSLVLVLHNIDPVRIGAGPTLTVQLGSNGSSWKLKSRGSEKFRSSSRAQDGRQVFTETAYYHRLSPAMLKVMAAKADVRLRLRGQARTLYLFLSPANQRNFQRFMAEGSR